MTVIRRRFPDEAVEAYMNKNGKMMYRRHRKDAYNPSPKQIEARLAFANAARKTKGIKGGDAVARELVKKELKGAKFRVEQGQAPVIPSTRRPSSNLGPLLRSLKKKDKPRLHGRIHFEGLGEE